MADITCCPRCKRPVEARFYMNPVVVAALDSVLPTITCPCGYYGLPIELTEAEYEKWLKEKT